MQTTSETYKTLLAKGTNVTSKEVRATIGLDEYYQDQLVEVKTTSALMTGDNLIGNCIASTLDIKIRNPNTIPRMAQIDIEVRLDDGETQSEWLPKGTYFIDTRAIEDDVLHIVAYDAMLKTEQSFTQAGSQGEWPRTDIAVVKEIAYRIGLSTSESATDGIDSRTLAILTNGYAVQYPGITLEDGTPQYSTDGAYSMREVLGFIGAMYGGNWCISDAGKLRLVQIHKEINPYQYALKFYSDSPFTISLGRPEPDEPYWDGTIEYSYGNDSWTIWDGTTSVSSGADNTIYFRGSNNSTLSNMAVLGDNAWIINGSNVLCDGNVEVLLDWETVAMGEHVVGSFSGLFYGNTALIKAPDIKCTRIADASYMFSECTNLLRAPKIDATQYDSGCCNNMFSGCTSLIEAADILAIQLNYGSCEEMYKGCTALVNSPRILVTTLNSWMCFGSMFEDCTSLVTPAELYPTALTVGCYYNMYAGCTSLKLSETQTNDYLYPYRIPTSGSVSSQGQSALDGMFSETGGTFTGTPVAEITYYCDHKPIGWVIDDD